MQEMQVWSLGRENPLEEGMETHSSILAWRILWEEEAGGLQSMHSYGVGHNWSDLAHKVSYLLMYVSAGLNRHLCTCVFGYLCSLLAWEPPVGVRGMSYLSQYASQSLELVSYSQNMFVVTAGKEI